jgi:hypothetical protein
MKAAVLHELNRPMTIEDFEIPGIGPDEVLIKVKACGVCHTDFKVIEGRIPSRVPTIIGHEVSGTIAEVEPHKYELLKQAWKGSRVIPVNSSWRPVVGSSQPLACPPALGTPWLVTLDPMTYCEEGEVDDANLYRADLERLTSLLMPYLNSGKPGMAAMFVYAIKPDARAQFWKFVDDVGDALNVRLLCCWMTHRGGSRNLAGLVSIGFDHSAAELPVGVIPGRD